MSKMGSHDPFKYLQHKLWLKTSWGSKCEFDSQQLKVGNCLKLPMCKSCAMYCWKFLDKAYNFALILTSIKGLHKNIWVSKMASIPILGIIGPTIWESLEKHHLDVALVVCHKKYY
jgi:hypothetical protein